MKVSEMRQAVLDIGLDGDNSTERAAFWRCYGCGDGMHCKPSEITTLPRMALP
jgi:hypothetical protein